MKSWSCHSEISAAKWERLRSCLRRRGCSGAPEKFPDHAHGLIYSLGAVCLGSVLKYSFKWNGSKGMLPNAQWEPALAQLRTIATFLPLGPRERSTEPPSSLPHLRSLESSAFLMDTEPAVGCLLDSAALCALSKLIQNFLPLSGTLGILLLMALSLLPVSPHARANHWPNVLTASKEPAGFVMLFHLHVSASTWLSQKISCWHFSVFLFSPSLLQPGEAWEYLFQPQGKDSKFFWVLTNQPSHFSYWQRVYIIQLSWGCFISVSDNVYLIHIITFPACKSKN